MNKTETPAGESSLDDLRANLQTVHKIKIDRVKVFDENGSNGGDDDVKSSTQKSPFFKEYQTPRLRHSPSGKSVGKGSNKSL